MVSADYLLIYGICMYAGKYSYPVSDSNIQSNDLTFGNCRFPLSHRPQYRLTAQLITSANAGSLKAVGEVNIQQPMRLVWAKNSQTFWVVNDANATRYNSHTLQIEFPFNAVSPGRILDASADGDSIAYDADNQGRSTFSARVRIKPW